jgi:putative hydrolase of the HAD superfamily
LADDVKRKYSAIVFDLGNVLIHFDYNILIEKISRIEPALANKFVEYYRSNYSIHRNFERGFVSEEKFINKMLEVINNRIDANTFCKYYADIFRVNKKVSSLLPILKNNCKLFLLSNTDSIHQKYGWQKYDFLKHFDKLILSYETGAVKPEEKIYRAVEDASGYPSEEHIFIDDVEEYVNAAKKLGWDGIHFSNYNSLVEELKLRDILQN